MAVTISRTAWTDDDGTGTTGTVINNAVKTELYDQVDAALASVGNPANLTASVPVNKGGTGVATLAAHGVVVGEGTSAVAVVGPDAAVGKPLLSAGASADPAFGDLGVAHGGTGATSLAAHGVVVGNGASAVNVTGAGSTGQLLTSNGASADPTFQANAALPGVSTITTTGNITALALPTGGGDLVIYMNNATLATIQGIAAGVSGQRLSIISIGAGQVDLSHQDAAATAANRLINFATSGKTSLAAGIGTADFVYDVTNSRWRLDAHEQGAPITATYAGGNFTGNASMTWTVDAGDVSTCEYYLRGRMLTVNWYLSTTSVGGTVSSALQITNAAWGSYTATKITTGSTSYSDNGAGQTPGFCQIAAAATVIQNFKQALANWTLATNSTTATGSITFEVN
jgi:hypothetical protein